MSKEKVHIEYMLNSASGNIIWNMISSPSGLGNWFADKVTAQDKNLTFYWGKSEKRTAELINQRAGSFVRFHWKDDTEQKTYFELRMDYNELTGDYTLVITDFAEPNEQDDLKELWDSQIEDLRRVCGL